MYLIAALAKTSLTWTLKPQPKGHVFPGFSSRQPAVLLTVKLRSGAEPIKKFFPAHTDLTNEQMLAVVLKQHAPKNKVLREWLECKGNAPVRLVLSEDELIGIGGPVHTALRKLADSACSVITWNSLHHMHAEDRIALWIALAGVVRSAFAAPKPPHRRALAKKVSDAVVETLRNLRHSPPSTKGGKLIKRTEAQGYALLMMLSACEMTEIDEWMWGWLGYVVEDV